MLNVFNGILFSQIWEKDLDFLRDKLAKQSIDDQQPTTPAVTAISNSAEQTAASMDNKVDWDI